MALDKFTIRLHLAPGAHRVAIAEAEVQIGRKLPRDYVEFLFQSNGAEGFVGKSYLVLWRIEDLARNNEAIQVNDFTPGLLLFGGDGGGEVYGFDMREEIAPVVEIPLIPLEWEEAIIRGHTFTEFLEYLYNKYNYA